MENSYKLTSKNLHGNVTLHYVDGLLKTVKMDLKSELNPDKFTRLFQNIVYHEADVAALSGIGLTVSKAMAANQKLALFCVFYEKHIGIKYKVTAQDSGKIKQIDVNEPLLECYFTSTNFCLKNKSVSNLVKYINEVRAELANPPQSKGKYPDHYDPKFEKSISGAELSAYWQHLHAKGWKPMKDRFGHIKEWIKQ